MEIKLEKVEEIDVLDLSGQVGFKDNLKVRELFKMISRKGVKVLVVDLDGLEGVPPMLVGTFALFHQTFAKGKNGKLVLCGIKEELIEDFQRNRVSGILPYVSTREEAIRQVKAG